MENHPCALDQATSEASPSDDPEVPDVAPRCLLAAHEPVYGLRARLTLARPMARQELSPSLGGAHRHPCRLRYSGS